MSDHLGLSADGFNLFLGGGGELRRFHGQLLRQFAHAENLHAVQFLADDLLLEQGRGVNRVTVLENFQAFHIHDNNGVNDQHLAPYMGILDWDRFMEGLKLLNYRGALCFETDGAVWAFHKELLPDELRLICRTGRFFARKAGLEE